MVRIGILGTGRMGTARAKAILANPGSSLAWVCSRDEERGRSFLADLGEPAAASGVCTSLDEALARNAGEAVVVASPNALHRDHITTCFDAGLHVFAEYPHATTVEHGRNVLEAATASSRVLQIGLTHHYSLTTKLLRNLVSSEAPECDDLGSPVADMSVLCSGNPISRWYDQDELSGGMFIASMYHFIDEARYIHGEVESLESFYRAMRDPAGRIEQDLGRVSLQFVSGTTSQITYARGFPKPGLGSSRTILFPGGYVETGAGAVILRTPTRETRIAPPALDALGAEIDAFVLACDRGGKKADPTAAHAQRSLEIAVEAQETADHLR